MNSHSNNHVWFSVFCQRFRFPPLVGVSPCEHREYGPASLYRSESAVKSAEFNLPCRSVTSRRIATPYPVVVPHDPPCCTTTWLVGGVRISRGCVVMQLRRSLSKRDIQQFLPCPPLDHPSQSSLIIQ